VQGSNRGGGYSNKGYINKGPKPLLTMASGGSGGGQSGYSRNYQGM